MPIPPLPAPRSSRDGDSLAGRRGLVGGSRGGITPSTGGPSSQAPANGEVFSNPLSPALYADDGHGLTGPLNEVREQAAELAGDLEQLDGAADGLTRVQRLVGRLRDAAVIGLDGALQPPQRAVLQRQVDVLLSEIDTVANGTLVEDRLLRGGRASSVPSDSRTATDGSNPTTDAAVPFRAIGTAALGLKELAVRSSDQAAVATSTLDWATGRLQRTGRALAAATARVQQAFNAVTDPATTIVGDPAIRGETNALGSTMLLRSQLLGNPDGAAQTQTDLDSSRVRWLLDTPTA